MQRNAALLALPLFLGAPLFLTGAAPTATLSLVVNPAMPVYHNCTVFTANDYYDSNISSSPIDSKSASYLSSMSGVTPGAFSFSYGVMPINLATSSTTTFNLAGVYTVPWQSSFGIEALNAAPVNGQYVSTGTSNSPTGPARAEVLNTSTCVLLEASGFAFSSNALSAGPATQFSPLSHALDSGADQVSISGLPVFGGAVRPADVVGGAYHALSLGFTSTSVGSTFVAPAIAGNPSAGSGSTPQMPVGSLLRLKASYTCPSFSSYPESNWVCNALKVRGGYVADGSAQSGVTGNTIFTLNPTTGDPISSYNQTDLSQFAPHLTDFDVVDLQPAA